MVSSVGLASPMLALSLATPTADTAQEEEHQPCEATGLISPGQAVRLSNSAGRPVGEYVA